MTRCHLRLVTSRPILALLCLAGASACDRASGVVGGGEPVPVLEAPVAEIGGLVLTLDLAPDSVSPNGPFGARVIVDNPTSDTIFVRTGNSCLFGLRVVSGDEQVPMQGSLYMCFTALTTHAFPPGSQDTTVYAMRAEYFAWGVPPGDGEPVPTGDYAVAVTLLSGDYPTLVRRLTVQ